IRDPAGGRTSPARRRGGRSCGANLGLRRARRDAEHVDADSPARILGHGRLPDRCAALLEVPRGTDQGSAGRRFPSSPDGLVSRDLPGTVWIAAICAVVLGGPRDPLTSRKLRRSQDLVMVTSTGPAGGPLAGAGGAHDL